MPSQPPRANKPSLLWIGDPSGAGIEYAWPESRRRCLVEQAESISHAASMVETSPQRFDLIVLACPRPLVDPREAAALAGHSRAECLQLLGVWCEGEGRTGRPPEGWRRVFWHDWPDWLRRNKTAPPAPAHANGALATVQQRLIVRSRDAEPAGAIARFAEPCGWRVAWERSDRDLGSADAGIWVGGQLSGREAFDLERFNRRFRDRLAPVLVMLDFPRPEAVDAATRIGATTVAGRPCADETLLRFLRDATPMGPSHARLAA